MSLRSNEIRNGSKRRPSMCSQLIRVAILFVGVVSIFSAGARAQELDVSPSVPKTETSTVDAALMPAMPVNEEVLNLSGDPDRPVSLEVTLFRPSGPGPFPLAIVNHGATKASDKNRGTRYRLALAAYYFLSRGYAVALPMMRGFAHSGGHIVQLGCNLVAVAERNAQDIGAVVDALRHRPDIDGTRVIVSGQSYGGWNTLGVGTAPPTGTRGLVLFNAALRSSGCPSREQDLSLVAAAGRLGKRTALPSIWFYGDNDSVLPNATWRAIFDRYKDAGTHAELVDVGPFEADSHLFLGSPQSLPLWVPKLDRFLASIGMPSKETKPGYLPAPLPPPTHWAALTDVGAVPFVNDRGRALYRRFLAAPHPRVFAIAPSGTANLTYGVYDPLGKSLLECAHAAAQCKPYAVDDNVVWTGPRQGVSVPILVKTVRKSSETALGAFYDVGENCVSRTPPQVKLTALPAHGKVAISDREGHPRFPPGSPSFACNSHTVSLRVVTYTPTADFTGVDDLTLERISGDGRRQAIRIRLNVL